MALTFTVIDSGYDQTNAAIYDTNAGTAVHVVGDGVVTLAADKLYYLITTADRTGGTAVHDSVIQDPLGTPLNFAAVTSAFRQTPVGDTGIQAWKVVPVSTTADAFIRIDMALGTHSQIIWCLLEVTGFDPSGTEVQVVTANGTASPATVTMAAYGGSANAVLSMVGLGEFAAGETITGEHTELSDVDDLERCQQMVQVQNPATDTTPSATYTEPDAQEHAIIGIEVKASGAEPFALLWRED